MVFALKDLAARLLGSGETEEASSSMDDVHLAAAILMVEVARADFDEDAGELQVVEAELQRQFSLSPEQVRHLMEAAGHRADHAVSFHKLVARINEALGYADKLEVLTCLP